MSMVDITSKPEVFREATATGSIRLKKETIKLIREGKIEKGDPFSVAKVAGILAAKNTCSTIPLCHPLPLTNIDIELRVLDESAVEAQETVKTKAQTGVEMEALTAVSVAALTIYDMCKAVDRGMRIESIRLARKSGGKSGEMILEQ